jgi:nucleoside-diphosphate-sugar epimerase
MFDCPRNLLLEQAVHPLSLVDHLIGPALAADCLAVPEETIGGCQLTRSFLITLRSDSATAQLHFSVGETYPIWRALLICDDGALSVDYLANRVIPEETRRWLPAFSNVHNGFDQARSTIAQESRNILNYVLSTLKLKSRTDVFFISMKQSIRSFYESLSQEETRPVDDAGGRLVALCSKLADRLPRVSISNTQAPLPIRPQHECEVALIGGTGFIGQHLVTALLGKGKTVAVMARNIRRLPEVFSDPKVVLIRGDATSYEDVRNAIDGAEAVVNLAHGGGSNPAEISRNLLGGALAVAHACLDAQTKRLLFISSIAALYLGDRASVITGLTEPDPHADRREAYSRAKAEAERLLLTMHREQSLPVCILRPGIVIGEGGIPFHLGVGFFNSERHCIGWNDGRNPLPFVLATDVAASIMCALDAPQVEGCCYNIVGDVRLSAREYIDALARAVNRPLRFHPQSVYKLFAIDIVKYLVKRFAGRRDPFPSLYDLRSRGLVARFDCTDAIRDLGWQPVTDRVEFLRSGIEVYGRSP